MKIKYVEGKVSKKKIASFVDVFGTTCLMQESLSSTESKQILNIGNAEKYVSIDREMAEFLANELLYFANNGKLRINS